MFARFKKSAVALFLGLGVVAGAAPAAQADTLRFSANASAGVVEVQFNNGNSRRHFRPAPIRRAACTPQRAVAKARAIGVNRPFVRNANRNVIRVSGFQRGGRVNVVFARAPGCPVIR